MLDSNFIAEDGLTEYRSPEGEKYETVCYKL